MEADIVMVIDEGQILATGSSRPVSEIELELKHGSPADGNKWPVNYL
jgi:inorganic triphosphatase YgiF